MVTIDLEKCVGCFACVSACPFLVLKAEGDKVAVDKPKWCIKCLHCAAACPADAIRLGDLAGTLPGALPVPSADASKQLAALLMTRRSFRRFEPKPVPRETLAESFRVAAWAPSAKNQHPSKWIVIDDEQLLETAMSHILDYIRETGKFAEVAHMCAAGHNPVLGNAKTVVLVHASPNDVHPTIDTALALYHVDLMLQTQGIGTCWGGYLTKMCNEITALRELLRLPEDHRIYGALLAGYPDETVERFLRIPNRHKQPEVRWL
jgi:nitroreductase/NAD-dependent dihydropyrimidine dehydrogenase PreA subunit